ncbi:MAG: acyl carrier protein [Lachnospiraceae bacterium]|nr:acyl carrier protein [Lachnospiraceae bacterium]
MRAIYTVSLHPTFDTDFVEDLQLNSLDIMNIICAFEDHFDTEISTREVWSLHKVKDVIAYMEEEGIDTL